MTKAAKIYTSELRSASSELRAGDKILLCGIIYTARDAAHKKICEKLKKGGEPPFDIKNSVIYYAGPTPTPPGHIIGSCGPTTSSRMDAFTPMLLELGVCCTIGKGGRSHEVCEAVVKYGAPYLCAVGGAGALIASSVISLAEVAFPVLGCESVKRLEVCDFPAVVGIDIAGGSLFGTF